MAADLAKPYLDAGIVTNDRAGALAFWNGILGFPVKGEVHFPGLHVLQLQVGDATLRLCIPEAEVPQKANTGAFDAATGLRYLTLVVRNLEAVVKEAAAAGYPVPVPPREFRPGMWAAQIQDGGGVTVELMEVRR